MKILIAGLGSIGRRHLRNLRTLGEHDLVLYRTRRSTLPDDELEGLPVELDLHAALARQPQAVVVANPTALHLDVAIPAANAGCALLLEKPVSHNLEGVTALRQAVQASGSPVLVGFQFRYHPGLQTINKLLEQGAIGQPISVRAHWGEYLPGWHPWEDYRQGYSARSDLGGGVILTLSHPLDYLGWLFGKVESLAAFSRRSGELNLDVEDIAEISMRFSSGVIASVHLDYLQQPPSHTLQITGSRGTLRWNNADGGVQLWQAPDVAWQQFPAPNTFERNDLFLAEMKHFIEVARRQASPLCSLDAGVEALTLACAALQSAKSGQFIQPGLLV